LSTAVITINVGGTLDAEDRLAINRAITLANEQRAYLQQPLLPFATGAERKASYETILLPRIIDIHSANIAVAIEAKVSEDSKLQQLKSKWAEYTPAQRDQILAFNPAP
jgi:hypothetical protein